MNFLLHLSQKERKASAEGQINSVAIKWDDKNKLKKKKKKSYWINYSSPFFSKLCFILRILSPVLPHSSRRSCVETSVTRKHNKGRWLTSLCLTDNTYDCSAPPEKFVFLTAGQGGFLPAYFSVNNNRQSFLIWWYEVNKLENEAVLQFKWF